MKNKVKIIVAVTENDAIGKNGNLLFRLKDDLKNFKNLTTNNVVIMGRKTFESIGKPLPNRLNVIISKTMKKETFNPNLIIVDSLENAIEKCKFLNKTLYIVGGGQIYKEAIEKDIVDEIILTRIKKRVDDADTFFPKIDYYGKWTIKDVKSYEEDYNLKYDIATIVKIG